jgi:GT2 family glycosyltransferase
VGAKLLYPNNTIQHAGVVMGIGIASHAFCHLSDQDNGYFGLVNVIRNYCSVTGACLMTRKSLYEQLGGLDENNLTVAYNDVDYCLKAIDKGYDVVYTPYALLYHHESVSRGNDNEEMLARKDPVKYERVISERMYMGNKWKKFIEKDPYYNIHLARTNTHFGLRLD